MWRPDQLVTIGTTLDARAADDDLVFNTGWGDFVVLFWHTQRVRFTAGLDPHYLKYGDPKRFALWLRIINVGPDEPADPAPVIREVFGARWVVVGASRPGLRERLLRSPRVRVVAHENGATLFEL